MKVTIKNRKGEYIECFDSKESDIVISFDPEDKIFGQKIYYSGDKKNRNNSINNHIKTFYSNKSIKNLK